MGVSLRIREVLGKMARGQLTASVLDNYFEKTWELKRTILVVDDDDISATILERILQDHYRILRASNGQEALDILRSGKEKIALMLLDLQMPVIDGFTLLGIMGQAEKLRHIPVIVITSNDGNEYEVRCIEQGAVDYITKPYVVNIVRSRVNRIIRLYETSALLNAVERDWLTGLYTKEYFFIESDCMLRHPGAPQYDLIVADVHNFSLFNQRYGMEKGDKLLRIIADRMMTSLGGHGICSRLHSGFFAILVEHEYDWEKKLTWQPKGSIDGISLQQVVVKYGVYMDVDKNVPVFTSIYRTMRAINSIKKVYGQVIVYYDEKMRDMLNREQRVVASMEQALREHQFEVYFQPKCALHTSEIVGAEALVRWNHPEYGFMSPADFIPLFESNGFITKLDFYVWQETLRIMKEWKEEGRKLLPVSVNISARDFFIPNLAQAIINLTDRYGIDHHLLHLEITESAYKEEPEHIIATMSQLADQGFIIEMDDFGSGYSSLNMLSELTLHVLKLDIRFIQKNCHAENGRNNMGILQFIASLSQWLNLVTIVEGVETAEQVEELKRIGYKYAQGYYYARPMPRAAYEKRLEEV